MNQKFKQPEAAAGKSRELETETFQKNGVSQRNQMRSGNIIQRMFLLFLVLFVSVASLFAQDVITLKNGDEIQALVQEIGDIEIKYKKIENPTGPNYTLKKSEVFMIKYATGSRDVFANVVEDKEKAVEKEATTTMSASTPSLSQQNTQSKKEIPYEPLSIRGARGRVANSYGVKLSQYEVREITSNVPEALDLYNNGMRKRTAGMIIGIPATLFCLAGVITTWSNELSDWPDQDTRDIGTALTVVGVAIGIPSLITSSVGNKRIRQSVNAYNKGIKQAHTSDISLNFGITSSGGIGLVLNF